ncbi:DNA cross-link repair 1A protein [Angomonas deanei]|uniref:Protein artemis n=1 Tax=Angomonas deanei TaxID=59799 RepID=A0A7G2C4Z3_9TRYP|nr:DNA cross-link repair 1A protein [Angomonas deanei]CAD2214878.1 DNA repair metallo-beta-lactamase, putative [Angomonas deanei]|eukprot:EPY23778.1 DNA cross-link repair 1A protein [Angomonas deanei]
MPNIENDSTNSKENVNASESAAEPPPANGKPEDSKQQKKMKDYFESRTILSTSHYSIIVDGFRFVGHNLKNRRERGHGEHILYFLTHFHSDHYTGLTSGWSSGMIYCSLQTAALCKSRLGINPSFLYPMELSHLYFFTEAEGKFVSKVAVDNKSALRGIPDGNFTEEVFSVVCLPANHCPGSVMLVFQSNTFGTILHTGDFRYNRIPEAHWPREVTTMDAYYTRASLQGVPRVPPPFYEQFLYDYISVFKNAVDVLYLDNTFCDKNFDFPSQWEINTAVVKTVLDTFRGAGDGDENGVIHIAVLVGSYVIGKERVALALQETFEVDGSKSTDPVVPIQVSEEKFDLFQSMNFFPERFTSVTSTSGTFVKLPSPVAKSDAALSLQSFHINDKEDDKRSYKLSLYLVSMGDVHYPSLAKAVQPSSESEKIPFDWQQHPFTKIIAVEPTGWRKKITTSVVHSRVKLLSIPYSEHCSFHEMVSFVRDVNPKRIVPTVSKETYAEYESYFVERAPRLASRCGNTQPLNRFFTIKRVKKEPVVGAQEAPKSAVDLPLLRAEPPASPPSSEREMKKQTLHSFFNRFPAYTEGIIPPSCGTTAHAENEYVIIEEEEDSSTDDIIVISDGDD